MSIKVKYIGTQQRWPELAITGKQSLWMPGQIETRDDVEGWKLLATGLFAADQVPVLATPSGSGPQTIDTGAVLLAPAELPASPAAFAGDVTAVGPYVANPRGVGIAGWGYLFYRDPRVQFDTVVIPALARNAGLTGGDQWSQIVVEVADASVESSISALFASDQIIASGSVTVIPSSDTIGPLAVQMSDPVTGRAVVLNSATLPSRYCIRYRAVNASGTDAVVGECRPASSAGYTPGFIANLEYSVPSIASGVNKPACASRVQGGTWSVFNGAQYCAFTLRLSANQPVYPIRSPAQRRYLRNWLSRLARILDGQTVSANLLIVGDSWAHNPIRWSRPIARAMKNKYGDSGPGFVGFTVALAGPTYAGGADDSAAAVTARTGSWVDDLTSTAKGLDAYSVSSSTVGDSITITLGATGTARRAWLHYWAQPGGGDVRWRVGAGAWTTISTASATSGMGFADIDFGTEITSTTITLEILTAGTGVTLHGIDLRRDVAGVRVHKLGHSGEKASAYVAISESITKSELASLSPDLVLICFTTNELLGGVAPAVMAENIQSFVERVRAVRPYCDFVIISQFDNAPDSSQYRWGEYEAALSSLAFANEAVFFATRALVGTWGDANRRGLINDTIPHPSSAGGHVMSGVLMREFLTLGI